MIIVNEIGIRTSLSLMKSLFVCMKKIICSPNQTEELLHFCGDLAMKIEMLEKEGQVADLMTRQV